MLEVEKYLDNFYKETKNPSLDAMNYFMNEYNNFEKEMKFIHIAGTNGKGSCTEIISNILINQGYKVGKIISPHLVKYNERISINGKNISDDEMLNLIKELKPKIEKYNKKPKMNITLFELETIMALLYFYRNNVDFVVLETGLGGLYDCTNIISKPLVSVITSIGYDHMQILGNTLSEIAYQKAGIIKNNSNTVVYEQEAEINNVFIRECSKKNNKLHMITPNNISNYSFDNNFQYFSYKDMTGLSINLKGKVQIQNASLCIETIRILNNIGYLITKESIKKGLATVVHKGRMEVLNSKPIIVFDGAHNESAIKNLQSTIDDYYGNFKKVYIISILKSKDYKKMLELLSQDKNALFVVTSGNDLDKYVSSDELYECARKYIENNRIHKRDIETAIEDAMNNDYNTASFVIGSFYTYSTVSNKIEEIKNRNKE